MSHHILAASTTARAAWASAWVRGRTMWPSGRWRPPATT